MTDYAHKLWNEAVRTGEGYVNMGGNPGLRHINIKNLTPEQIQMANEIEQRYGQVESPKESVNEIKRDSKRANDLGKGLFSLWMGRQYMKDYPTGYAAPLIKEIPNGPLNRLRSGQIPNGPLERPEPATVNDLVASVNANGSLYDYTPEGVQLPRDLDVLNRINPQTGRPYGRDLEEMQNPMTNAQNPEWTRRRVRDLININRIKQ